MEHYLYLAHIGVDFEGSGVVGVHTTLEAAKIQLEAERVTLSDDKGVYFDNSFFVHLWDTQTQTYVYSWHMDRHTAEWESWAQGMIKCYMEPDYAR